MRVAVCWDWGVWRLVLHPSSVTGFSTTYILLLIAGYGVFAFSAKKQNKKLIVSKICSVETFSPGALCNLQWLIEITFVRKIVI